MLTNRSVSVLPVEVNAEVPEWREEALVQVVQLVVVLHQQLQTGLVTTGSSHGLTTEDRTSYITDRQTLRPFIQCSFTTAGS